MIEKLTPDHILGLDGLPTTIMPDSAKLMRKINELVDAVNNIVSVQEKLIDSRFVVETKHEEPVDTFAEQKKWIGKLCKFWDYDGEEKWFSKLENIDKNSPYSYCASGDWWYKHCEPVKPDDDIIYKGE